MFLNPTNGTFSLVKAANLGETSLGTNKPIVLNATPDQPISNAFATIS